MAIMHYTKALVVFCLCALGEREDSLNQYCITGWNTAERTKYESSENSTPRAGCEGESAAGQSAVESERCAIYLGDS